MGTSPTPPLLTAVATKSRSDSDLRPSGPDGPDGGLLHPCALCFLVPKLSSFRTRSRFHRICVFHAGVLGWVPLESSVSAGYNHR